MLRFAELEGEVYINSNGVFERGLKCTSPKQSVISQQQQQHKENGYICFAADTRFIIKGPATTLACYLFIARSIPLRRILNYTSFLCASGGERKKKEKERWDRIHNSVRFRPCACVFESEAVNQLDNGFNFAFPFRALPNVSLETINLPIVNIPGRGAFVDPCRGETLWQSSTARLIFLAAPHPPTFPADVCCSALRKTNGFWCSNYNV